MSTRARVTSLVCSILVCFGLTGCGGGSSGGGTTVSPPPVITLKLITAFYSATSHFNGLFAIAGQSDFTLTVNGTGFSQSSVVNWNGSPLQTTFGLTTDIAAYVPASLTASPGKAVITVTDSGATSNAVTLQIASPAAATAHVVQLISIAPDGTPANADSLVGPSISATGRFVAFQSAATNLAPGPASGFYEIYERDTCIGAPAGCVPTTIRITVTADGSPPNSQSRTSAISADGRYVSFDSQATNILPATGVCGVQGPNGGNCVFIRDTCIGAPTGCVPATTLASQFPDGTPAGAASPTMSADGRYIGFDSQLTDLVVGQATQAGNVFSSDTCIGAPVGCVPSTIVVSLTSTGGAGNSSSNFSPVVDQTGRFFAFESYATNLTPGAQNLPGIFLRDTCNGASACSPSTSRADVAQDGSQPNNFVAAETPSVSPGGRFVAFGSKATNLVSAAVSTYTHLYVRDTCNGAPAGCSPTTTIASVANDGSAENCASPGLNGGVSFSADGRFLAFGSISTNLSPDDHYAACGWLDIFVRDTCSGAASGCVPSTVRVSVIDSVAPGLSGNGISSYSAISADGHYVAFLSGATDFLSTVSGIQHEMVYLAKTGF